MGSGLNEAVTLRDKMRALGGSIRGNTRVCFRKNF